MSILRICRLLLSLMPHKLLLREVSPIIRHTPSNPRFCSLLRPPMDPPVLIPSTAIRGVWHRPSLLLNRPQLP